MDEMEIRERNGGVTVAVAVKPSARREAVVGVHAGALKLTVRAAPEKGRANRAAAALLGKFFDIPPSAVELVRGGSSRRKVFFLPGLKSDTVREKLVSITGD